MKSYCISYNLKSIRSGVAGTHCKNSLCLPAHVYVKFYKSQSNPYDCGDKINCMGFVAFQNMLSFVMRASV